MERQTAIREFIRALLARKGDTQPFSDDTSLLLSGRLQSVDAVDLAVFLEETFAVDFADIGFDQEMVDTVDAICALVERLPETLATEKGLMKSPTDSAKPDAQFGT